MRHGAPLGGHLYAYAWKHSREISSLLFPVHVLPEPLLPPNFNQVGETH